MFTWYVARRLFLHTDDVKRVSKPAIRIATLGVAIGVATMLISASIVLAFQSEIRNKVVGFGSHIKVINYDSQNSEQYNPIVFNEETLSLLDSVPNARFVAPFCLKPGMLKTDESFRGVAFKGIGSRFDYSFFLEHLADGDITPFQDTVSTNKLIISQSLSKQLNLSVGSSVYAYFFEDKIKARKFTVSAIYCTNLTDFDNKLVFTDVTTVQKILGFDSFQYSGAEIKLSDFNQLDEANTYIINNVNRTQDSYGEYYTSMTIFEMNPRFCLASITGSGCLGNLNPNGLCGRVYHDKRFADYHSRTHQLYWCNESAWCRQFTYETYFSIFQFLYYLARTVNRKSLGVCPYFHPASMASRTP